MKKVPRSKTGLRTPVVGKNKTAKLNPPGEPRDREPVPPRGDQPNEPFPSSKTSSFGPTVSTMKPHGATKLLAAVSELLFSPGDDPKIFPSQPDGKTEAHYGFDALADAEEAELADLLALASANHAIVRALGRLEQRMAAAGNDRVSEWAARAIEHERRRIDHALPFFGSICRALEDGGGEGVVVKPWDRWPGLCSDL